MNISSDHRLLLRAGPLSMIFDVDTAFLRRIRRGAAEVVRGVYAAVRDHEWTTIPIDVRLVEKQVETASFRLAFDVEASSAPVDFRWRGIVTGDESGVVRYEMKGRAHSSFRRNRIGFCVLHPVEGFAGESCLVEHDGGAIEEVHIPASVSPHQPVFDIRALTYDVDDDLQVEVRFENDVFEMEDQRNWSDASFKTYCTPLERPKPVVVHEGDVVDQAVIIRLLGDAAPAEPGTYNTDAPVALKTDESATGAVPAIGAYYSGATEAVALPFNHLRVDVQVSDDSFAEKLSDAAAAARRLSVPLFISAMLDGDADRLAKAAAYLEAEVSRWLVLRGDGLATSEAAVQAFHGAVETHAPVGGGTNAYFTEINRMPPTSTFVDFICFSVNPQVHAFDELSMMETLPMHATLAENARELSGGCPVAVSPITLRPRYNPEAVGAAAFSPGNGHDPRQDESFGAAWTAGSFVYLCRARTELATYHDVSTLREPVAGLLRRMLSWQGLPTLEVRSSDPERVVAVSVSTAPRATLVVNLTAQEQRAHLDDASSVELPPYGYTIIEETG